MLVCVCVFVLFVVVSGGSPAVGVSRVREGCVFMRFYVYMIMHMAGPAVAWIRDINQCREGARGCSTDQPESAFALYS